MCLKILASYSYAFIGITQHPASDTFCEGSNAVLSCIIFDNSTNNAADATSWFTNENPPAAVPFSMINNIRDANVVTSTLTIVSISLNDNGTGYFCVPSFPIASNVGVISVAGEYEWLYSYGMYVCSYVAIYVHMYHDICVYT